MLSHLKSVFSLLQGIYVKENLVPFQDLPIIIAERKTPIQEPMIGPIRTTATKLLLNRISGNQYLTPVCQRLIGVVGMDYIRPSPSHRLFFGLAEIVQPTLAEKIGCSVRQGGPLARKTQLTLSIFELASGALQISNDDLF